MDLRNGLGVTYTDEGGNTVPAIISAIADPSGIVDLVVFVSEAKGCRDDQAGVHYSATPGTPNTWSNI